MEEKIRQDICIGSNIRVLRRRAHLTQKQVSAASSRAELLQAL